MRSTRRLRATSSGLRQAEGRDARRLLEATASSSAWRTSGRSGAPSSTRTATRRAFPRPSRPFASSSLSRRPSRRPHRRSSPKGRGGRVAFGLASDARAASPRTFRADCGGTRWAHTWAQIRTQARRGLEDDAGDQAAPPGLRWVALLLLALLGQLAYSVRQESLSWDEGNHIYAGYMSLKHGDFGLNPEHPPLVKMLAALPLLSMDLREPPSGTATSRRSPI